MTETVSSMQSATEEVKQPKRPLSAYNYFFRSERARLLGIELNLEEVADVHNRKKRRHRKTHGQMGFREMANKVGERWRSLDAEERAPFVKMFENDRARYKAELKKWNDAQKEKKKEVAKQVKAEKQAAKKEKAKAVKAAKLVQQKTKKSAEDDIIIPSKLQLYGTPELGTESSSDGMDNFINRALDILNEDDFAMVEAVGQIPEQFNGGQDQFGSTSDYIDRAINMIKEDDLSALDVPYTGNSNMNRKRPMSAVLEESEGILNNTLKNVKSYDAVMDFDSFLENFDDEPFAVPGIKSSNSHRDNGLHMNQPIPSSPTPNNHQRRPEGNLFDDCQLDGIEPVSTEQMHNSYNMLESELGNIATGDMWSNFAPHQMHQPGSKLLSDFEGSYAYNRRNAAAMNGNSTRQLSRHHLAQYPADRKSVV